MLLAFPKHFILYFNSQNVNPFTQTQNVILSSILKGRHIIVPYTFVYGVTTKLYELYELYIPLRQKITQLEQSHTPLYALACLPTKQ